MNKLIIIDSPWKGSELVTLRSRSEHYGGDKLLDQLKVGVEGDDTKVMPKRRILVSNLGLRES